MDPIAAVAAALLLLYLIAVGLMIRRQAIDNIAKAVPSEEERKAAECTLWLYYPAFPDDEPDTALFLLEQARTEYIGWIDSNASIESKATWMAGFLAGGAGLLTILGSGQGEKAHLAAGPFLALALVFAALALIWCLYVVRPKLRIHPSVSAYVTARIAYNAKARFHVALALAEEYGRATVELAKRRRFDPVAWTMAQISLICGVGAILVHFALHVANGPTAVTVLQCQGQLGAFHQGAAAKITCQERSSVR